MELQEILRRLERNTGFFPRPAVEAAVSRREEIIPELLRILEDTERDPQRLAEDGGYMAHIYAMLLLAQFREARAYPLLLRFFSLPGELPMDLTGNLVTEDLGSILASVSHGDTSGMIALVENEQANEYVRNAALRGMVASVACGEVARETVIDYFAGLFHGRLERKPTYVWSGLVCCCTDLYPGEVYNEIRQAYEDGLVDEWVIRWKHVEEDLALGKEQVLERLARSRAYRLITDTVAEMQWWACFKQPRRPLPQARPWRSPVHKAQPKIGRNDPCPCGSGKKYKKCCGA